MDEKTLQKHTIKLLRLHAPIKSRKLVAILNDEFGKQVDRSDLNVLLYRLQKEQITAIDAQYQWSLLGVTPSATAEEKVIIPNTVHSVETPSPVTATIEFTAEQQAVIDLDPEGDLLIRGQAGSGKTTVLAARAGKILSATNKGTLLFLTYNTALCAYVKKSFETAGLSGDIDVRTFHDWAKASSEAMGANFDGWVTGKARAKQVEACIAVSQDEIGQHRLYELSGSPHLLGWWGEEVAWLFGQHITRLDDYLKVERVGRGTAVRVTKDDRRFVWHVFEQYEEWLDDSRKQDYDNPAGLLLRTLMETGEELAEALRFDHLMIDEVQDFDKSWLLAAVKVPRVSLSLAGDLAQKIYRRSFTWTSVGIKVQGGRSRKLSSSHRTTRQVMEVASYLLENNSVARDEDYSVPLMPSKEGVPVRLLLKDDAMEAYEAGYDYVADNFKRLRTTTVAVVLPFTRQLYPCQKQLEKRNLGTAKMVKGVGLGKFGGGIAITTYHQLKGLEFDHVVIMGLHDSQYPGRVLSKLPEEDQADEADLMRRVLYVAMTRARQSVTLVGSKPFCRFFKDVPSTLYELIDDDE